MRARQGAVAALVVGVVCVLAGSNAYQWVAAGDDGAQPVSRAASRGIGSNAGLEATASRLVGADEREFAPRRSRGALVTVGGGLSERFGPSGPTVREGTTAVAFRVTGYGVPGALVAAGSTKPVAFRNDVSYHRGGLTEWYRNGPFGLEQGFTLARPTNPVGATGVVVVAMQTSGESSARLSGSGVVFGRGGQTILRYGQLTATDATGRSLPARIALNGATVTLRVGVGGARYPVTIDPFVQQGSRLVPSDETHDPTPGVTQGQFGFGVAVSADGQTALVGGPVDGGGFGAAWVFARSGSTWAQQGPKLVPGDENGLPNDFGYSVAVSADGNTALIGGYGFGGAAWIYTRSGSTWAEQEKLGPVDATGVSFGRSVAISADGTTALVGDDDYSRTGAAWIFVRSGSTWTQQGAPLSPIDYTGPVASFGASVALSSDGSTALIGGYGDDGTGVSNGAAWVFTRSGSTWTQQGAKLTASDGTGEVDFGTSVSLSGDGNTALVGGPSDNGVLGAAWIFTRSGTTWSQDGSKLTATGETTLGDFGSSVALSGDGNTAVVGGPGDSARGAVWVFSRSGQAWSQIGSKFTGGSIPGAIPDQASQFGASVAVSNDGNTAIIGGPGDLRGAGAAWVYANAPVLSNLSAKSYTLDAPPILIGPLVAISDPSSSTLVSATLTFAGPVNLVTSGGFMPGDVVAATTAGTGITASYAAGTLSLTGTAPVSVYQTVLSSVTFASTALAGGTRRVAWVVDDGAAVSAVISMNINVPGPPAQPTGVTAAAGNGQATVSFFAPSSPSATYTVTASPGGATASRTSSPITVTGLTNGVAYSFTVVGTDSFGSSPVSAPSNTVTPMAPDSTPPTIAFAGQTPPANAAGWNNGPVTLTWTCADSGSGPVSPAVSQTVSAEGANQSVTGTCVDNAGNMSTDTRTVSIDQTAPAISFVSQTPTANGNGWNNTPVTVNWACSDGLSGAATSTVSQTLTADGASQTASGSCADLAGNTTTGSRPGINIDSTPPNAPTADASRPPDFADGGGWYKDTVTVSFSAAGDPAGPGGATASGVDPTSIPVPVTFDTDGSHAASGTVDDLAGNHSAPGGLSVQVDATPPVLTASFANADGSVYVPGTWTRQSVTAEFVCTDTGGSGVASVSPPVTVSTEASNDAVTGTCVDDVGHATTRTFGNIQIDKTAPEAYLVFDPASHSLLVYGTDAGGSGVPGAAIAPSTPQTPRPGPPPKNQQAYRITDRAGNTLVLVLTLNTGSTTIDVSFVSLSYNGAAAVVGIPGSLHYDWTTAKDGSVANLHQDLHLGKPDQHVSATYDSKKDQTLVMTDPGGARSTLTGLALIKVATHGGKLAFQF